MRVSYFLIILLISLQSYSIYTLQNHPLAKLWRINDTEVPEWLNAEKHLIMIYGNLRPILAQINFISSFGGPYINIFENCPYKESLHFENVTNSMVQLKFYFQEITLLANNFDVRGALVYIDIGLNNIVIYFFESDIDNTKFINAVEPFNPEIIYANTQSVLQNIIRP
ncbi:hypothetical protein F8M41_017480 [Gigaspora margarita]|uniref:Uncharacterized protein n=1 Tax=Gigaspora margarita TaxID=4874 RepID=A0A8H4AN68_GIGMA|nr:hypothetical protein F8M41_017480 [Gigaspora margarita]